MKLCLQKTLSKIYKHTSVSRQSIWTADGTSEGRRLKVHSYQNCIVRKNPLGLRDGNCPGYLALETPFALAECSACQWRLGAGAKVVMVVDFRVWVQHVAFQESFFWKCLHSCCSGLFLVHSCTSLLWTEVKNRWSLSSVPTQLHASFMKPLNDSSFFQNSCLPKPS